MKHKFKLPTTDRLIGISAMIISILTLIIFIYQTHIISKKSKLSVKPRLVFETETKTEKGFKTYILTLTNKGLGPAIIQNCTQIYQNINYPLVDFDHLIMKKFPDIENEKNCDLSTNRIKQGDIIPVNETITVYELKMTSEINLKISKYLNIDDLRLEVIYSSMYEDETWRENNDKKEFIIEYK